MIWRLSGSSLVTLGGAIGLGVCALYVWQRRRSPAAVSLAVLLLAATEWSLAHTVELSAGHLATRELGGILRFVGTCLLPPVCLIFMLQYSGRMRRPRPAVLALLAIEPLLVLTVLAVPATRHLMITFAPTAPGHSPVVRTGPLYWVDFVYFNLLMCGFAVVLVATLARASRLYRKQSAILFGALLLPLASSLLFDLRIGPLGRIDFTPFAFVLTAAILVWGVFRFSLLDLRPVARSRIFQTIADPVVVLDLYGKVIDANLAAERMLGLPLARAVGQPVEQVLPAWAEVIAQQRRHRQDAVEEATAAGGSYEVAISSLTDYLGQPTGQLLVARDVTERHRVDEMKKTFLHAVSHELRTPLAAVLGIAVTLERQQLRLTSANQADLLGHLANSARKLDRLLADLLDLDRLDQPTVTPKRRCVDLGELVGQIVEEATPQLLDGHPVRLDAGHLLLSVDAPKVERIMENLLANAARHTPPGTPVWVRVEPHDRGALLVVEDAGPGVPDELREAIFEPFRQGPNPSSYAPGLGVGLTLVHRFAELHGGRAWVENRPGSGASFRVLLPDADHAHVSSAVPERGRTA